MVQTAAIHTMTYGIVKHMKNELSSALKDTFFSINVDEATNNAGDKVLNVVCQYYDIEQRKIINELLGLRIVNKATSENIMDAVKSIFRQRQLHFGQLVSATMDNCSMMRGFKSGLKRLKELNPSLLNFSEDIVHIISNPSKAFFELIDTFFSIHSPVSDIFYDIEDSPKIRSTFRDLHFKIYEKSWSIIRIIPTRFLQILQVCDRIDRLWDGIILFYYSFLPTCEKEKHPAIVQSILSKHSNGIEIKSFLSDNLVPLKKQKTLAGIDKNEFCSPVSNSMIKPQSHCSSAEEF